MEYLFYSVYDQKLERYNLPYVARNDQEAIVILIRSGIPKSIYDDTKLFRVSRFVDDLKVGNPMKLVPGPVEVKLPPFPIGGDQNV